MRSLAIAALPLAMCGCQDDVESQGNSSSDLNPVNITCETTEREVTTGVTPRSKMKSAVAIYQIDDKDGAAWQIDVPTGHRVSVCQPAIEGEKCNLKIDSSAIKWNRLFVPDHDGDRINHSWSYSIDRVTGSISGRIEFILTGSDRELEKTITTISGTCRPSKKSDFRPKF